jgi:hypothetical protein
MIIPDPGPDFYPSRIPDIGTWIQQHQEEEKKFVVLPLFVVTNFTKFKIILFLSWRKKFCLLIYKELCPFHLKNCN